MNARTDRLPEIDRLRGLAILLVVFHHLAARPFGILAPWVDPGWAETWTGVDLFFVISGFVVTRSLLRASSTGFPATVPAFFRRRFWRIFPAAFFWAAVPAAAVILASGYSDSTTDAQIRRDFWSIATLSYNYAYAYSTQASLLLSPYWSLCVEEHFYLILPLLFLVLPGKRARSAFCLLMLVLTPLFLRPVVKAWVPPPHPVPYYRCRLDALFFGVLLALTGGLPPGMRVARIAMNAVSLLLVLALVRLPALMNSDAGYNSGLSALALVSGALVLLASQSRGWVLDFPGARKALEALGRRSFSVYLAHVPAYFLVIAAFHANGRSPSGGEAAVITICYLLLLAALAQASFAGIEDPLRGLGRSKEAA